MTDETTAPPAGEVSPRQQALEHLSDLLDGKAESDHPTLSFLVQRMRDLRSRALGMKGFVDNLRQQLQQGERQLQAMDDQHRAYHEDALHWILIQMQEALEEEVSQTDQEVEGNEGEVPK